MGLISRGIHTRTGRIRGVDASGYGKGIMLFFKHIIVFWFTGMTMFPVALNDSKDLYVNVQGCEVEAEQYVTCP